MTLGEIEKTELESQLREFYTGVMTNAGMSKREASAMVKDIVEEAKRRGAEEATDNLPSDYGRQLIRLADAGNLQAAAIVNRAREDGASDADIEEWWGLQDLQRRLVVWSESVFRLGIFNNAKASGKGDEDAGRIVWKMFPIYGIPEETDPHTGEDRRLAHEIRGRVDRYRREHGAAKISEESKSFLTYNAFVRAQIRRGHL